MAKKPPKKQTAKPFLDDEERDLIETLEADEAVECSGWWAMIAGRIGISYVLMSVAAAVLSAPVALGEGTQTWRIDDAAAMADAATHAVSAVSADGDRLTLGCAPAAKSTWIGFRPVRAFVYDEDDVVVRYKIDGKPAIRLEFAKAPQTGAILEGEAAAAMIAGIAAATQRVTYQDEYTLARFDVSGLDDARRHLAAKCPHLGVERAPAD